MSTWSERSAGAGHIVAAAAILVSAAALSAVEIPGGGMAEGGRLFGGAAADECPTRGGASASLRPGCKPADEERLRMSALFTIRDN